MKMSDSDGSEGGGYDFDEQGSDVSLASDEEGNSFGGFLDEDASDAQSDESDAPSGDGSDADESREPGVGDNGLFDMEASESDGHSDTSSTMSASESEYEAKRTNRTFHAFSRLPAELREMIWRHFCPDLTADARIFEFELVKVSNSTKGSHEVWESAVLDQQTQPTRAVLSTCRESRALAFSALPDTLPIRRGKGCIRFHREKDVVRLRVHRPDDDPRCSIPGFTDKIKHIALDARTWTGGMLIAISRFGDMLPHAHDFLLSFPALETVYSCFSDADHFTGDLRDMSWLRLNDLHTYHVRTEEEGPGVGEDLDFLYCWPVQRSLDVVKTVFPTPREQEDDDNRNDEEDEEGGDDDEEDEEDRKARYQAVVSAHDAHGYWHLPMVNFEFEEGIRNFDRLMRWKESGDTSTNPLVGFYDPESEASESDIDTDLDGFIADEGDPSDDDGELELDQELDEDMGHGDGLASDDYDLALSPPHGEGPRVEDLFDSEHDTLSDDGSEEGSDDSGASVGPGFADQLADTELPAADFSSPEPDPKGTNDSESSSSEEESLVQVVSRPKRHIVSSDSDESSDDVSVVEPQRRAKRRIVSSDSEGDSDDSNAVASRPAKRARVVVSESEDED
jgi:hypothetical protein